MNKKDWRSRCEKNPDILFKRALSNAKKRALKRNSKFDIDLEYIKDIFENQSGKCYYSGIPLRIIRDESSGIHDHYKMTLDCLDSNLGYSRGNVVWCIYCINSFKLNMPKEEMIKICKSILKNNLE